MPFKLGGRASHQTDLNEKLPPQIAVHRPDAPVLVLDKLYHAVAVAESNNCSTAWHKSTNNCVSIMSWTGGTRHLKQFKSIDDNRKAFKELWVRSYGNRLPTIKEAAKYTGNDNAGSWLGNVLKTYNAS